MRRGEVEDCGTGQLLRQRYLECDHDPGVGDCICDDNGTSSHGGRALEDDDVPPTMVVAPSPSMSSRGAIYSRNRRNRP